MYLHGSVCVLNRCKWGCTYAPNVDLGDKDLMWICEDLPTIMNINGDYLTLFGCCVLSETPRTTWASDMVHYPTLHPKFLYWTWDMQFVCLLPGLSELLPNSIADNLQPNQSILKQDMQSAVPPSCSLDGDEKSEMFNARVIRTRARQVGEPNKNQHTWRVKNYP